MGVFTAGRDGIFDTADDVREQATIGLDATRQLLTVTADVDANVRYKVRLDSSVIREVEDALAQAKRTLEGEDAAAFRSASETLSKAAHRMAEALYQKTASGGEKPTEPAEDVVDAEFTEVK